MKVNKRERAFLLFFLPLFTLKMLNTTAENSLQMILGIGCFLMFITHIFHEKYDYRVLKLLAVLLVYTAILVFTCGKQGPFFSIVMVLAMKGIDMDRKIYKICYLFGVLSLAIACYLNRNGVETMRFVNGEWVSMIKRSNILYVCFTALACLYMLKFRKGLTYKQIVGIFVASYFMFVYVGSRTGFISMIFLIVMILLLKNKYIKRMFLFKYGCLFSPLICMLFSVFSGLKYGKFEIFTVLDMMLQGRIAQNNAYLNRYDIKLFGQHIYEGSNTGDFWNLDSAYLDMLICEGLIFALLWIVVSFAVIKYMYNRNRMIEVAILVMYAIYGISETFLPNCFLNMSLFLYGEYLYSKFRKMDTYVCNSVQK